jgi:hypothetical protein
MLAPPLDVPPPDVPPLDAPPLDAPPLDVPPPDDSPASPASPVESSPDELELSPHAGTTKPSSIAKPHAPSLAVHGVPITRDHEPSRAMTPADLSRIRLPRIRRGKLLRVDDGQLPSA